MEVHPKEIYGFYLHILKKLGVDIPKGVRKCNKAFDHFFKHNLAERGHNSITIGGVYERVGRLRAMLDQLL